eukprot:TRINITY_DN59129_c0_g1_i2.p2 TRINITY_DN59129_c0_g1~~TRINITY_DN59129_c0_g1_i2.p2  ORF type:complete len:392 (-),score=40.01 TRINITY_DN59129_c0_g1_i2:1781-2908(-)
MDVPNVVSRCNMWAKRNNEKRLEEQRKKESLDLQECTFAPSTTSYSTHHRSQSPRFVPPHSWSDYQAYGAEQHIERLQKARNQQANKRGNWVTGQNWKNRVTKPRPFALGKHRVDVRSLEKPLSPPSARDAVSGSPTFLSRHDRSRSRSPERESYLADQLGDSSNMPARGLFSSQMSRDILDQANDWERDELDGDEIEPEFDEDDGRHYSDFDDGDAQFHPSPPRRNSSQRQQRYEHYPAEYDDEHPQHPPRPHPDQYDHHYPHQQHPHHLQPRSHTPQSMHTYSNHAPQHYEYEYDNQPPAHQQHPSTVTAVDSSRGHNPHHARNHSHTYQPHNSPATYYAPQQHNHNPPQPDPTAWLDGLPPYSHHQVCPIIC